MNLRRIMALLMLVAFFSVTAQAFDLSSFRLRIEDPVTGVGRVLTDNVTLGFGNNAGDQNSAAGTLYFSGFVESFNVTIQAISKTANADGTGGGVLILGGRITYSQATAGTIKITLEDNGYNPPAPPVTFNGVVGGYDWSTKTVTDTGNLTGGASSVTLQSWLDVTNSEPQFGTNTGSAALTTPLPNPVSSSAITAFAPGGAVVGTSGISLNSGYVPVTDSAINYSIVSQVTVTFASSGAADFSLTASDPGGAASVPEPTSLLLLGSAFLGLGALRKKKQS